MGADKQFEQIVDEKSHDAVINKTNQNANIPIVMLVTSSTPLSSVLRDQLLQLSEHQQFQDKGLKWYELPLIASTTPLVKFGPQNCPFVVLFRGSVGNKLIAWLILFKYFLMCRKTK